MTKEHYEVKVILHDSFEIRKFGSDKEARACFELWRKLYQGEYLELSIKKVLK